MLPLAILGLAVGAIYAVYLAPREQKLLVGSHRQKSWPKKDQKT